MSAKKDDLNLPSSKIVPTRQNPARPQRVTVVLSVLFFAYGAWLVVGFLTRGGPLQPGPLEINYLPGLTGTMFGLAISLLVYVRTSKPKS